MKNKELEYVLKKQCEFAGINYNLIDFKSKTWYSYNQWSKENESKFKEWLENELYTNTKIRKTIMQIPTKNKKLIKKCVDMWNLNYGFETKD